MAVYTLFRVTGIKEAWYQLTEKQRQDLLRKNEEMVQSVGGKRIATYRSYTSGMNVSLASFPSLEAAEKVREAAFSIEGLALTRYMTYERDILYELPPGA